MAPTHGKIEGKVTVPAAGWSGTIDDSGGAGAVSFTILGGTYYLSSSGSMGSSLITAFSDALNTAAPTDTITVAISAAESGTGKVTITSTGTTAITWVSTDLRDVLGFVGNLAAGTTWTGSYQARSLWLPNCAYKAPNAVGTWRGWREADLRSVENAAGYVFSHMGQEKEVSELSWNAVARSLTWEANATTVNASWERFARDCVWGVAGWGSPGGPLRFYPSASDDAVFVTYKPVGINQIKPEPLDPGWSGGPWRVVLPRLIVDPASENEGLPRDTIVITNLTAAGSTAGGTTYTTASITTTADTLVLVTVMTTHDGTVAGNAGTAPSSITGAGLTFTKIAEINPMVNVTAPKILSLWRAYATSSSSGALTITHAGGQRTAWSVVQASGVDGSGTNGSGAIAQYKTGVSTPSGTAATATFTNAIAHPSNMTFVGNGHTGGASSFVVASGYTQTTLGVTTGTTASVGGAYKFASATATLNTSPSSGYHGVIMVELVAG